MQAYGGKEYIKIIYYILPKVNRSSGQKPFSSLKSRRTKAAAAQKTSPGGSKKAGRPRLPAEVPLLIYTVFLFTFLSM